MLSRPWSLFANYMRRFLKRQLAKLRLQSRRIARGTSHPCDLKNADTSSGISQATQQLLLRRYNDIGLDKSPPLSFRDVEMRFFSQFGEDGILLYFFGLIGMKTRRVVEICAGVPKPEEIGWIRV